MPETTDNNGTSVRTRKPFDFACAAHDLATANFIYPFPGWK